MSQEEKPLSPLEAKISQAYRDNEAVEDEQREIEVRLNKIEGLKPLLPNRKYGQKTFKWSFKKSNDFMNSALNINDLQIEGSDSLDHPDAVFN